MVLWAATCPVMVVPTERGAAQRLSFAAPNPRFDALVPRSGGSDRLAMISPEEWSPRNGGDAA
jgi:hypothetical protein